jgi:hypothetical protein
VADVACELWAIDAGAGEAILREGKRWYLSSMEHAWRPIEVNSPQGVLEWSLSRHVVPVSREYGNLDRAVIMARRLCRAAWKAGGMPSEEVRLLLDEAGKEHEGRRRSPQLKEWEERLPEIIRQAVELDRFFQVKGCSSEESLRFTLRVLEQLRESGEWRRNWGRDLLLRLFDIARAVYLQEHEESPGTSDRGLSDYLLRLYKKSLGKLSLEDLGCLALWADANYSVEAIAILLSTSAEAVHRRLDRAATEIGRPLEQLRVPGLADLCRALLSRAGL